MKLSVLFIFAALASTPWIFNGVKFLSCDFKPDYKCEVVHGAGVFIPPASLITVWFSDDGA